VAEYSVNTAHRVDFDSTSKLGTATRYMDHLVKEAIEIQLHLDSQKGFNLSHTHPVISMLLQSGGVPVGKKGQAKVGM